MTSFDVSRFFTNVPLDETIELCLDKLFHDTDNKVHNMSRSQLRKMFNFACKQNHFMFDGKFYDQCDGVSARASYGKYFHVKFRT